MGQYTKQSVIKAERPQELLDLVYGSDTSVYATELADELDMDRSMASEILTKFEEIGLVTLEYREKSKNYRLTEEGMRFIDIKKSISAMERALEDYRDQLENFAEGDSDE